MSGLVYFSSVSGNTRRFVEKLGLGATRIPLHPHREGMPRVTEPYVLIVPTYGGGERAGAVPKQVVRFLNIEANRALLRGVIASGNTNFGADYCLAGRVIAAKCQVPELYRFELLGTDRDVRAVREGLRKFWTPHSSAARPVA
ncbi:class Ib ribonucleoside-diphosphate reductase assembly flavoprotein NrdI [Streptomyces sp. NPDC005438]|uniref:class Ib ribonucleoside-diphosphate reductase assembly flavoprotein NrdI n=1 Tax=Streptomyces sp. NPDC005438 TaxID=3156880 RepID=UPI0033B787A4